MRTALAALVLVALPASSTVAAVKRVKRCQVLEAGNYHAASRTSEPDLSSPTGRRFASDGVEFTSQTRTIARTLGTGFGFRYRLNLPVGTSAKITTHITYPRPIKGKKNWSHPQTWEITDDVLVQHVGYTFTHDFEMVPGAWTMQVLVEDKPACLVTFTVK
jgi:hypothetical protein